MNWIVQCSQDDFERLPQSVKSAIINQVECIKECEEGITTIDTEVADLDQKISISKEIGMPTQGIKGIRTRKLNEKKGLLRAIDAYRSGYMEIPDLGDGMPVNVDNRRGFSYVLPTNIPLRVFEDLKVAKQSGLFDEIVIFLPRRKRKDPIMAGRVAERTFLISNWR